MAPHSRREEETHPRHEPVLAQRCLELLTPALQQPGATLIDATLGLGGHAELALQQLPGLRLIGIDRDPQAITIATERLGRFGARVIIVSARYDDIGDIVAEHAPGGVQAVLMDLGVSSLQLDEASRGFAYSYDGPLDMRMDPSSGLSAAELLARASQGELRSILQRYGEERFAARIAHRIVQARETSPVQRSGELADLVREAVPAAARRRGGHPAKRTFQALRIAVNDELAVLRDALPEAIECLTVGGRIVVMSYQSLEDRLVKRHLARGATSSAPPDLPIEPESHRPYLRLLTRGAERAEEAECVANPRAASVRLRGAQRLRPTPQHLAAGRAA